MHLIFDLLKLIHRLYLTCHSLKKARPNLAPDEIEALNELIQLQKKKVITIKPCDKGAGIIILDFDAYIKSCNNHLSSQ